MSVDKALHQDVVEEKGEWPDWEPPMPPTFPIREELTAPQRGLQKLSRYLRAKLARHSVTVDGTPRDDRRA